MSQGLRLFGFPPLGPTVGCEVGRLIVAPWTWALPPAFVFHRLVGLFLRVSGHVFIQSMRSLCRLAL